MPINIPPITDLPQPPLKTDPANFASRADTFLDSLPDFVTETNAAISEMNAITSGLDQLDPIDAWSAIPTYNFPDAVAGSDGFTYRCIGTNNINDNPVTGGSGEWIQLGSGGGLKWGVYSTSQTTAKGKGFLEDTTTEALTVTLHAPASLEDMVGIGDAAGTFENFNCTVARNGGTIMGEAEDLLLDVKNQRVVLVCTTAGANPDWTIVELEPNNSQFEYMPYAVMLLQDQKTSGTAGGSSIAGTQTRTLALISNEISGATFNSNQFTLPAGNYKFNGYSTVHGDVNLSKVRLYNVTDSAYVLEGESTANSATTSGGLNPILVGYLTFTSQKTLELRTYTQSVVSTYGLGIPTSQGTEVYASLEITKIGNNYAPRLITTDAQLQMVAGLDFTGNVLGFDITKTGATQLTITPGTCKNHDGTTDLYTTTNTVINDAVVANTLYHFAVVKLNSGNMTVQRYASEAAMAADVGVNITHFRWIGEWLSNGSDNYVVGIMVNGLMLRGKASECIISANITTSYATVNHTTQMTPSRVEAIEYGVSDASTSDYIVGSDDGASVSFYVSYSGAGAADTDYRAFGYYTATLRPFNNARQFKALSGTLDLLAHMIKYRR